jgi:undecaprenyl diphosphate synthase
MANNVRMRHLGRRDGLPQRVLDELDHSIEISAGNTGMWLNLALNYGGRAELADGVRSIARDVAEGRLKWQDVNEDSITHSLYTAGLPDPDLLIRTAGELRLSNFLLWQVSYAEIYVTQTFWPDFDEPELHRGIQAFAQRNRRFGGLSK